VPIALGLFAPGVAKRNHESLFSPLLATIRNGGTADFVANAQCVDQRRVGCEPSA